jgi:uncharacterized protein YndB with AHSA1/START domain/DNA-binding transcriptional ArsR family regulator
VIDDLVFRALADPSRRRLLDRLNAHNGQTLRELCAGLAMTRQSVSKHLALLEAANLVSTQWRGREKLHFLNAEPINAISERWITRYDRARADAIAQLKHALEQPRMDTSSTSFVYATYIKTTPEQLWAALTDPAFTRRYWGVGLVSDWNVGSTVTWQLPKDVTIADSQQVVLAAEPSRRLSYTWHTLTPEFFVAYPDTREAMDKARDEPRSKVTFEIEPQGSDLVKLTVTHDDFEPGSIILGGVSEGWPAIIASLKTLLETGEPLMPAAAA